MRYQDLHVWQRSIEPAEMSYRLSARFPRAERFGITSQMRRSAASVAANIAEGASRHSQKEFLQFLRIAGGSPAETETYLVLARRLEMADEERIAPALALHVSRYTDLCLPRQPCVLGYPPFTRRVRWSAPFEQCSLVP